VETFNAWLSHQTEQTPGMSAIFVMGLDGTCLASSNRAFIGNNFGFRPYFQEALAGHPYSSDWAIGTVTHTPRLFSSAPVLSGAHIVGVVVTEHLVEELERTILTFGQSGRSALLINRMGIVLTHSNPDFIYGAIAPIPQSALEELNLNRQFLGRSFPVVAVSPEFTSAFQRTLHEGISRTERYHIEGQAKWGALNPIKGQAWVITVSVPESAILAPARAVWRETITVGILSSTGAFLFALGLVHLLLRPLRALSSAIAAFGQGIITSRAPIQTHQELDHLAQAFNTMADTIQNQQENLESLVRQRTQDLEQALAEMKSLEGMIPICSYCKQIRDDGGSWWKLESYIQSHSEAQFSHGICPDCRNLHFPRRTSDS
jgi:C4-dicarboxylate-specific signal transduction histidine kinase